MSENTPELYNDIWDRGEYRYGSTAQRLVPFLKRHIPQGSSVNDYGSGTGRAELTFLDHCKIINMVDFADHALEEATKKLIGPKLTYTISPLESLPADFPYADWGMCINVLMVVDPEKLQSILKEMYRTCENLIIEVYDWPDMRLGKDRTQIKMEPPGWIEEISKVWPKVEYHESPEHKRRYIFICNK